MPSYNQTTTSLGIIAFDSTWTGAVLNVTRVSVGSGTQGTPLTATGLANEQLHSVAIAGKAMISGSTFALSIVVNNASVTSAFLLSEVGVWGTSGSGPEQLLIYITDSTPITISAGSATLQNEYIRVGVATANTSNVTVTITAGVYALEADYIAHLSDPGAHPQAFENVANLSTTLRCGLVPQLNGDFSYYFAGDGTWQPGLPVIINDTTLYVDPTYNDVSPYFSSIPNAANHLARYLIAPGVAIKIVVNPAIYTSNSFTIEHVNGQQISVYCSSDPADINFNGAVVLSGAQYNWSVQLQNCSSLTGVTVGKYISVYNSLGSFNAGLLTGCFKVTAISGSNVTVTIPFRGTSWPPIATSHGSFVPIPITLSMHAQAEVNIGPHGLGLWKNIAVIASTPPSVGNNFNLFTALGPINLAKCGFYGAVSSPGYVGAGYGFACSLENSNGYVYKTCVSGSMVGFSCGNKSTTLFIWAAATHNSLYGVWAEVSLIYAWFDDVTNPNLWATTNCWAVANGQLGIFVADSSKLVMQAYVQNNVYYGGSWMVYFNGSYGVLLGSQSNTGATMGASNPITRIDCQGNGSYDLVIAGLSVSDAPVTSSRNFNQAVGVLTANGVINS